MGFLCFNDYVGSGLFGSGFGVILAKQDTETQADDLLVGQYQRASLGLGKVWSD